MHRDLKLPTLSQRRELHMGAECYKHVNNENSSLHSLFQKTSSARTRTGDSKCKVPDIRSHTGRKCFSYRGPVHWNSLSEDLKSSENIDAFKKANLDKVMRGVDHPE